MLPRRGSYGGWQQVAETSQVYEAELMALRLRESGIEAEVLDQSFRAEPLPMVRSFSLVRVLVPVGRAEEARRVLAQPLSAPDEAREALAEAVPSEDAEVAKKPFE